MYNLVATLVPDLALIEQAPTHISKPYIPRSRADCEQPVMT